MAMWVFGYGSLLWNPGFEPEEAVKACAVDFHRSFCMLSIHHRGTVADPGLVLALDEAPGQRCTGLAFRVPETAEDKVLEDLRARELISSAYVERHLPLALADGRSVEGLTYVIERDHVQYCQFDLETQAGMIARAVGGRGPNHEYLFNTVRHLQDLGIRDRELEWLVNRVSDLVGVETFLPQDQADAG
jgi:cation transport protein ChaC